MKPLLHSMTCLAVAATLAWSATACGSAGQTPQAEDAEQTQDASTEAAPTEAQDAETEANAAASETAESAQTEETADDGEKKDVIVEEDDSEWVEMTDEEVEAYEKYTALVNSYDYVLSYGWGNEIDAVFGYHIPDGWRSSEDTPGNGKTEAKYYEHLQNETEDEWVGIYEPLFANGQYDYDQYIESLDHFYQTGTYAEPERLVEDEGSYLLDMRKEGEMETPYGTAVLYTSIAQSGTYNDSDLFSIQEGAMIPRGDMGEGYYIEIEYTGSDWDTWSTTGDPWEALQNHAYTGRLEELLPLLLS